MEWMIMNAPNLAESSVLGIVLLFSSAAKSWTSSLRVSALSFLNVPLLASFDCSCAASNSFSLTVIPSSSAINLVKSTGKPKVSYNRHTSAPWSSLELASLALEAYWSKSFSPRSSVRANDSSSSSRISLISSCFFLSSGKTSPYRFLQISVSEVI